MRWFLAILAILVLVGCGRAAIIAPPPMPVPTVAPTQTPYVIVVTATPAPALDTNARLAELEQQTHLAGDPAQLAADLERGGLSSDQALGEAFIQAAVLVNVFDMSVPAAAAAITAQYGPLGRSSGDVATMLQDMARAALNTGASAPCIGAVLAGSQGVTADVRSVADIGPTLAMFCEVYGDAHTATQMANVVNAEGNEETYVANMLGLTPDQLAQVRTTVQGQGQLADMVDAEAKKLYAAYGADGGVVAFNSLINTGQLPPSLQAQN